jgi:CBS-domain-containing membrane protein
MDAHQGNAHLGKDGVLWKLYQTASPSSCLKRMAREDRRSFMSQPPVEKHPIHWPQALLAGLGAAVAIGLIAAVTEKAHWPLLMSSLGSSAVLVFGFPESPFCRPARVVAAHVLCAALGLICLKAFGQVWWAQGLSVGLSLTLMMGLRVMHPPAGGNPLLVFAMQAEWSFLFWHALLGSLSLVTLAWLWQKCFPKTQHQ